METTIMENQIENKMENEMETNTIMRGEKSRFRGAMEPGYPAPD